MKYALLLSALLALPAQAQLIDGNFLLEYFRKSEKSSSSIEWGFSRGYVTGVYDTNNGVMFCAPSGVTLGQLSDMTHNYLENTPAVRHRAADVIIFMFMGEMWPCPKKGKAL